MKSILVYEDESILVFNKPSGLPCQTRNIKDRTFDRLLWAFARSNGKRPRMVHRLDTETSGIIMAANTQPAAIALSKAFEDRQIRKTYLALVDGDATKLTRVDSPIGRVRIDTGAEVSGIGGQRGVKDTKEAITRFRCVTAGKAYSLIECRPETGRMHQIRVHLAHAGHSIIGDPIYGDSETAPRMMLHAWQLHGPHPIGGQLDHTVPVPDDFEDYAGKLSAQT